MYMQLLSLSILIRNVVATCDVTLPGEILPKYQISEGTFRILDTIGLTACQRACLERAKCLSLGFNKATLKCYLGGTKGSNVYTGNKDEIYIEPDWNTLPESLGPCRTRQCSSTERCVPLSSGNYSCSDELVSVDLTVVFQASTALTTNEFQSMVSCTQRLLPKLHDVRMAVLCFSGSLDIKYPLDRFDNLADQHQGLGDLSCGGGGHPGGNDLKTALKRAHSQIFNGSTGDRQEGKDVIVVMMRPDPVNTNNLALEATEVKSAGVHIVAVGLAPTTTGNDVLNMIVSEPIEENKLIASSVSDLTGMETQIAEAINLSLL